ncbi:hypothetical protein [Paenibacillus popilliae]|uniref:Outer membrane receptor protein n=1 Tax=Paenibacillus popilliae ATCC 14706 TaxID=1212764 RepID=M9LZM3_PAEPP|nr:hypothetical protein [Paenibacillus popilliae]GAC41779.1 outer membrane receptor protein [Paenibacillus popilliae ATCC 14706]
MKHKNTVIIALLLLLLAVAACAQQAEPAPPANDHEPKQIQITVINSTGQEISGLRLNTGENKYNQSIRLPAGQHFQTAFPYVRGATDKLYLSYADAQGAEQSIKFPPSNWIDHDSLVFVMDMRSYHNGIYEYVCYANEEEYQKFSNDDVV